MPAIIVRGTIHGMARLGAGVEAIGGGHWGHHHHYYPGYYSTPSRHYSNGRSSYRDIALMRVAEVPVIQVGGAVALLP